MSGKYEAPSTEGEMVSQVVLAAKHIGLRAKTEVSCGGGSADLVLSPKDGRWLMVMEAKLNTRRQSIASALGQVLIYSAHIRSFFDSPIPCIFAWGSLSGDIAKAVAHSRVRYFDASATSTATLSGNLASFIRRWTPPQIP